LLLQHARTIPKYFTLSFIPFLFLSNDTQNSFLSLLPTQKAEENKIYVKDFKGIKILVGGFEGAKGDSGLQM